MLESLQSTTLTVGYGMLASPTITSTSGTIKPEKDEKGNKTGYEFDPNGSMLPITLSAATTGSVCVQEANFQKTMAEIKDSQAIVESLSDEELAKFEQLLVQKELEFELEEMLQIEENQENPKRLIR